MLHLDGGDGPTKPSNYERKRKPINPLIDLTQSDDEEEEEAPEQPAIFNTMNDPCISHLGPIVDALQSDMFPNGIPDRYETNLPFHPSHQYVNRTQCTNEGLRQVSADIVSTQERIAELATQVAGLGMRSSAQTKLFDTFVHKTINKQIVKKKATKLKDVECASRVSLSNLQQVVGLNLERARQLHRNQQRVSQAIRIGINFRVENPGFNFVVFINEDFPIVQRTQQHQGPAFPQPTLASDPPNPTTPINGKRKKRGNTETNYLWGHDKTTMFEIKEDITNKDFPVHHVKSIDEFFQINSDGHSKIIVYPFEFESPAFVALKNEFSSLFWVFSHTVKGYHNKAYYSEKITLMNMAFVKFNEKLQEANDNLIDNRKEAMTRFKHFIMMMMNEDIRWYWKPDQVIREMTIKLQEELVALE